MDIPILDNMIVADSTVFSVALSSADTAAVLNPANANITIEDDDSKHATSGIVQDTIAYTKIIFPPHISAITIRFQPATYTVAESAGSVNVTVVNILNGSLVRDVHVFLMTSLTDGTATGI